MSEKQKLNDNFFNFCMNGDLDSVKQLLINGEVDIHIGNDLGLMHACRKGHLHIVKYLLTSPDLKEHANIHANNDQAFRWACRTGQLNIIKYLVNSSELKQHANIHAQEDAGFKWACRNGHLNIVEYLLTSPDLKNHANPHANKDFGLRWAYKNNKSNIVEYLIFEFGIKQTEDIKEYIEKNKYIDLETMFKVRDLNNTLESQLTHNQSTKNKFKV